MNKSELVDVVAGTLGGTGADAERAVSAVIDGIKAGLRNDGSVSLVNFGTFEVRERKARTGRNPRTGATIKIAASKSVGFRAGKALKDML
ncbi:MAG: HU family DNA-binding protein [Planctomycetes bacterium]|nr:HU family DNA-binding protein [Planctomycetota bacterium]